MKPSLSSRFDWQVLTSIRPALSNVPSNLRRQAERWTVDADDVLFRIGDRVTSILYVLTGEVRLVRRDRLGKEIVVQRSCGGFFAEASLNSIAYHCDVVVVEKGELLCFPASTFREALDSDKTFRDAWLQHLARELRRLRSQCERMNLRSAAQRIFHYIESEGSNGEIRLTQPKKAWANELGLTHEALYRALRRLQSDGTLTVDGPKLQIMVHQVKG